MIGGSGTASEAFSGAPGAVARAVFGPAWRGSEDLRSADEELARLGRFEARDRLHIGELLDALFTKGGHHELGFSSERAYVLERCGQKDRWAQDTRRLARRLRERGLDQIRDAIMAGRICFSMAELLARHATAETQAELLEQAQHQTVREMKRALARSSDGSDPSEDEDEPARVTIRRQVGPAELFMVHTSRPLVEMVTQERVSDEALLSALLGEAESALVALEEKRCFGGDAELPSKLRRQFQSLFDHAVEHHDDEHDCVGDTCAKHGARESAPTIVPPLELVEDPPLPADPMSLDAEIVRAAAALTERHLEMGRRARVMLGRGWFLLGYQSPAEYARERVGVSLSTLEHRVTLARRASAHPELRYALVSGHVGTESAMLIGQVLARTRFVEPALARAWVDRARRRTVVHLREEVNAVLMLRDFDRSASLFPPEDQALEEVAELERKVQSGELYATLLGPAYRSPQMSVTLRAGRGVELRLRVSQDLARHMLDVEQRFRRVAPRDASFVAFMCFSLWSAWLPWLEAYKDKWKHIYLRDRHRCLNPTCDRHDVTPHHFWFQSHGGGHEDRNLGSLCFWCHILGVHGGRIKAAPPANDIQWLLGRTPILEIRGREKIQLRWPLEDWPKDKPSREWPVADRDALPRVA